jgi:hypothetical protein
VFCDDISERIEGAIEERFGLCRADFPGRYPTG